MDTGQTNNISRKRTANACVRCRTRKVKCSGTHPCADCARRSLPCHFEPEDRKVVISERYLRELREKSAGGTTTNSTPLSKRRRLSGSFESVGHSSAELHQQMLTQEGNETTSYGNGTSDFEHDGTGNVVALLSSPARASDNGISTTISNPLACEMSVYLIDGTGRQHFLGPSSTFSFSRQTMDMLNERLGHAGTQIPLYADRSSYKLDLPQAEADITSSLDTLPSLDYALYLINTVKFHLGQLFHLLDEAIFKRNLHEFYDCPVEKTESARLWFVQFELVLAFGKAFLVQSSVAGVPPGFEYISKAMSLLPDIMSLDQFQYPIESIEILCLVALYLQSADYRNSAYVYVGQALRNALLQRLHLELKVEDSGEAETERRRSVWWTVYVLDRKFSSLMGTPPSIHDADITVKLPPSKSPIRKASALGLHVKLSRLIAKIMSTVYGADGRLGTTFLNVTRSVLESMASLAHELEGAFELKLNKPIDGISRVTATLNLYYHQCIVLATRPLFFCLLRKRLELSADDPNFRQMLSEPVKALLKTCGESASKILRILTALMEQNQLETYLPFDLEHAFSSTLVLMMISAVTPTASPDFSYLETTRRILDDMIHKGKIPAQYRKMELDRFEEMLQALHQCAHPQNEARTTAAHDNVVADSEENTSGDIPLPCSMAPATWLDGVSINCNWTPDASDGPSGLSAEGMLSVAQLFDLDSMTAEVGMLQNQWLWDVNLASENGGI